MRLSQPLHGLHVIAQTSQARSLPSRLFQPLDAGLSVSQRALGEAMVRSHQLYSMGECAANIRRFLGTHVQEPWVPRTNVLVMLHAEKVRAEDFFTPGFMIEPEGALFPARWSYHVLLACGGRVYDFDYRGEPGAPLPQYAEEMFGSKALHCHVVMLSPQALMGRRDSLLGAVFGPEARRLALGALILESQRIYGIQDPLHLPRRETTYASWGLLEEDIVFRSYPAKVRARAFGLRYEAGSDFTWSALETLLAAELARIRKKRPRVQGGFVQLIFPRSTDVSEATLRGLVERVMRPLGLQGRITFISRSYDDSLPQEISIEPEETPLS